VARYGAAVAVLVTTFGVTGPAQAQAKPSAHVAVHLAHRALAVGAKDTIAVTVRPATAHLTLQQKVRNKWVAAVTPKHSSKGSYAIVLKARSAKTVTYRVLVAASSTTRATASTAFAISWTVPVKLHVLTAADEAGEDSSFIEHTSFDVDAVLKGKKYAVSTIFSWADDVTRGGDAYETFALAGKWKSFQTTLGVSDGSLLGRPGFVEVLADGRSLGKWRVVGGAVVPLDLDVRGVQRLTIDVVVDRGITVVAGTPMLSTALAKTTADPHARSTQWLDDQRMLAKDSNFEEFDSTGSMSEVGGVFYGHADVFDYKICGASYDPCDVAWMSWDLSHSFTRLTGKVAVDDSSVAESATVVVSVDEVDVATGTVASGAPFTFDVPVTGAAQVRVSVQPITGPVTYALTDARLS
jgi:hypothetical protein